MTQPLDIGSRERILAELAMREAGQSGAGLTEDEESTLAALRGELETLVSELREPPPVDPFEEESGCLRAIELVEQIGRENSFSQPASPDAASGVAPQLDRLGPYELSGKLGQGGMGTVYRATHPKLKRVVALKVLPPHSVKDQGRIARFEREMEAIGALNHPNIVAAYDAGEFDGMHYLVMEYVDGLDLATLVRRTGPLDPPEACEIVRQAVRGLIEAFEHGIVHRDIKPSNLMLARSTSDGGGPVVKILDFGLARLAPLHADDGDLTSSGLVMGTLKYMAPEQCSSSRDIDIRADIYSLGATLYKLLCGASPFSEDKYSSPLALLSALANEEPPRLAARRKDVPPQLVGIVHRMMAKNPADRFATPAEVAQALAPWSRDAKLEELLEAARASQDRPRAAREELSENESNCVVRSAAQAKQSSTRRIVISCLLLVGGVAAAWTAIRSSRPLPAESGPTSSAGELTPVETAAEDKVLGRLPANDGSFDRSRAVAAWLSSLRGRVGVFAQGQGYVEIAPGGRAPDARIQLSTVDLKGCPRLEDEGLSKFSDLPLLEILNFANTRVGDAGLENLGRLPHLQHLFLVQTLVTDRGLAVLRRYPGLVTLYVGGTRVTDAGVRLLAENRRLQEISFVGCEVSDVGLASLGSLPELRNVWVNDTPVTAHGIVQFNSKMPDCRVHSNFSEAEIRQAQDKSASNPPR